MAANDSAIHWDAVRDDAAATMSRYVQFDTTNPPGDELLAAEWLADQLIARGITRDVVVHQPAPNRGLVLARIPGSESLKPLLINHHIDVVAADPSQWTHPPFGGVVADGFVWGRGTLDTKNLGVVFLLALESLVKEGVEFRRPIVFLAVPDEEVGGDKGMRWLVENHATDLDPEWVWDEGSGGFKGVFGPGVMFGVAVAEKRVQWLRLIATGDPGHGSLPHANNANVTLLNALARILQHPRPLRVSAISAAMFRSLAASQKFPASLLLGNLSNPIFLRLAAKRLSADKLTNAELRDTISLNVLKAGYKTNVIPESAEAELDCRLLADTDPEEFLGWLARPDRRPAGQGRGHPKLAGFRCGPAGQPILPGGHARGESSRPWRGHLPAADARRHGWPVLAAARLSGLWLRPLASRTPRHQSGARD